MFSQYRWPPEVFLLRLYNQEANYTKRCILDLRRLRKEVASILRDYYIIKCNCLLIYHLLFLSFRRFSNSYCLNKKQNKKHGTTYDKTTKHNNQFRNTYKNIKKVIYTLIFLYSHINSYLKIKMPILAC